MRLYVASSWKNGAYPALVESLRAKGHDVLDWRIGGFSWREVSDTPIDQVSPQEYRDKILQSARAREAFFNDFDKMQSAEACVLLLPCGRSAHIEAGWFWGVGKPLHIFIPKFDTAELMYKGATSITFNNDELFRALSPLCGFCGSLCKIGTQCHKCDSWRKL